MYFWAFASGASSVPACLTTTQPVGSGQCWADSAPLPARHQEMALLHIIGYWYQFLAASQVCLCLLVRLYVPCSLWLLTGTIIWKLMGTVWCGLKELNENDSLHASISVSDSRRAWFHLWGLTNWTACLFSISLFFLNLYSYKIRHNLLRIAFIQL